MHSIKNDFRIQRSALKALQEAAESALVAEFSSMFPPYFPTIFTNISIVTNLAAIYAKRVTI